MEQLFGTVKRTVTAYKVTKEFLSCRVDAIIGLNNEISNDSPLSAHTGKISIGFFRRFDQ